MNKAKNYSGELDLWRFILALGILIHHSELLYGGNYLIFRGGSIFVEFFFITSGLLMTQSAYNRRTLLVPQNCDLSREVWLFIKKRLTVIYPYILLSSVISFIIYICIDAPALSVVARNGFKALTEILLVNWSGLVSYTFNGPTWYISCMLLSFAVLYPLILKYGKTISRLVCPLIAVFLLGYLKQKYGNFRNPSAWDGLFLKGMIRGFAEISLGAFCYECVLFLRRYRFTAISKTVFTVISYITLIAVIFISNSEHCYDYDASTVIAFAISIVFVVGNNTLLSGWLGRIPFVAWLGRFSMILYLNHRYLSRLYGRLNEKWGLGAKPLMLLYVGTAFAASLCAFGIISGLKLFYHSHQDGIRRVFLTDGSDNPDR